ncbi:hypothetical protein ACV3V0_09845 [Clostridium perfringens]
MIGMLIIKSILLESPLRSATSIALLIAFSLSLAWKHHTLSTLTTLD